MHNNETYRFNNPSDPKSSALTLRTATNGPSQGPKVLFIAASALCIASMPGVADHLLSSLGSAIVSTAHAGEPNECKTTIHSGYEKEVIHFLKKHEVKLPEGVEKFVSLFELSSAYDATILRDRQITILVSGEGEVLPAPQGFYVFPDGIIAEIGAGGLIGSIWGEGLSGNGEVSVWSMCQPQPGVWVEC
ncbi:hypothetical protein [Nannocystis bainbridge]|uniref:Uncharacterized protein n=1 Tax=Nannocystis bainbridge TaxID=2995303 RepID=A0ABT5E4T6_9BACT|nr:hypothetical protein [Nannocystis bainbridge]MDC0720880.1 hypothetical protein [Nannocystis bainbridge]